jgi:integrase/recombinase XerC
MKPIDRMMLLRDFRFWLLEQGYSTRTATVYGQYVKRTSLRLETDGTTLKRASLDDLRRFWSTLPATRSSRNGCRGALIAFYKSQGRQHGQPADGLPAAPEPHRLPRPMPEEDHTAFIDAALRLGGRYRVMGLLFALTGCRFSEVRRARWHQFHLGDNPCFFAEGKGSARRGPKTRQIPLHPVLVPILAGWRSECGSVEWLFPTAPGKGYAVSLNGCIGATFFRELFYEICDAAGIERIVPHQMRHTVATLTLDRSRDVRAVQELLGHESLSSTQLYT